MKTTKNTYVAVRTGNGNETRNYLIIDTDIATGDAKAWSPETGYTTVNVRDRDAFQTEYINAHPYDWMK